MTLAEEISQQIEIRKNMFTTAEPGLRDFFGNLIDERSPKMTNEEIRNNLNLLTGNFEETARVASRALSLAAEGLDTFEQEAYDRGLNDCWEMVRKLRKIGFLDRKEIFPLAHGISISDVLDDYTPQQALAKIRAWERKKAEEERKKQEEAEKIQIGDVVEVYDISGADRELVIKGIYLAGDKYDFVVLHEDSLGFFDESSFDVKMFTAIKTGKHVDILGVLK
jgi:hypothetical protein